MNKVITINLGGIAFQLEDVGYDALNAYLENAKARLQHNPDRDEILSDIERAIGEKFSALLNAHKNVILAREVQDVLAQMGEIDDEAGEPAGAATAGGAKSCAGAKPDGGTQSGGTSGAKPKRLYRIHDGAIIAGVCNGLATYFNVDPTIVRLAFIILTLLWGTGILVYVIMAFVVPQALTPEEKAAAAGTPPTAQDFIRRAKEGYYDAMKNFPDRQARREWKRKFKQDMREWRSSFDREVRANVEQWRCNWHRHWYGGTPPHPGSGIVVPVFSILHGALTLAWICALISLLATGAILGVALPAGLPVWAAIVILMFCYGILSWPLKAARRAFYWGGGGTAWPFVYLVDTLVWVAFVVAIVWLVIHYTPELRDAVHNLPAVFHDGVNSVRDWWHSK